MNRLQQPTQPQPTQDTTIYADNHTLFIEEKQVRMEPVKDAEGNIVEGFYEQTGGFTLYKLFIGDFDENGNGIQRIINALQNAQPEDALEFHVSSHGGLVSEVMELYNLVNTLFYKKVVTYCNFGYSAGALAFLFGEDRVIYKHSDWMMHSYSGGFVGKRDDMLTHLEHEDKRISEFFDEIMAPYFTKKELKKMQAGKDFWMSSEELLKRKIATHIMVDGEILEGQTHLENLYPERKEVRLAEEEKLAKKLEREVKKAEREAKKALKEEKKDK